MATEALKSIPITNRDATPVVLTNSRISKTLLHESIGNVTTTSGVTAGSTYRMCEVPSNARVSQVILNAGAMTQGAFDIGVYRNTADGGAVVSAALFGSAVSCAAAVVMSDVTNESGSYTVDNQQVPLWLAAGLPSYPGTTLDIVCTSTNTITTGALLGLTVRYSN